MAFTSERTDDLQPISAGEKHGQVNHIFTTRDFADGLVIGRFAQVVGGSVTNVNATATPVIAGVVLRKVSNDIDSDGVIDRDYFGQAEYLRMGLVTVRAVSGESPTLFAPVFVSNTDGADAGKATLVDGAATETPGQGAEFIEAPAPDVWLIRLL